MIAKIVEKDKREYYSIVFAICHNGWDISVIVFDNQKNKFSFVKMYDFTKDLTRSVFIIDANEQDFVRDRVIKISSFKKIKNINGYDWLVDNPKIFLDIVKNKAVSEEYCKKAKQINGGIVLTEWTLVKNKQDVENLMSVAWGFHDSVIEKVVYNAELENLEVVFSGCWGSKLTLSFQADPAVRLSFDVQFMREIFSSNIFFENGFVYWVDDASVDCVQQLEEDKYIHYFRSRILSWKQTTEYNSNVNIRRNIIL